MDNLQELGTVTTAPPTPPGNLPVDVLRGLHQPREHPPLPWRLDPRQPAHPGELVVSIQTRTRITLAIIITLILLGIAQGLPDESPLTLGGVTR